MRDTEQQIDELIANSNRVSKWVEEQPSEDQISYAQTIFTKLYASAAQPRSSSGNACVKLCGFVQQASKSSSTKLRAWAFSQDVVLKMFNFYIEWNESDNHRSMKLVLDLVPQLLRRNPDDAAAQSAKRVIVENLVSIIVGKSPKPLAKSAIKALDHFLNKGIFTLEDIKTTYVSLLRDRAPREGLQVWRSFFAELFHWMRLHFVCPTAGRFIMSLYRFLRRDGSEKAVNLSIGIWHNWLLEALIEEPSLLESIKTYIFLPLFKADRGEALQFLKRMNEHEAISASASIDLNLPALLQLAALETGKNVGLVEEPALNEHGDSKDDTSSITLHEKILESVLAHPSNEVRSLALSLVISSPSTTRPYSSTALDLLRKHLGTYFAESDAKFRNDVSSKVRDMFKRVRGAIFVLKKSIPRAAAKANGNKADTEGEDVSTKPSLYRNNLISLPEAQLVQCLDYHENFLSWYLKFLSSELAPTTSYQRHIASLKAVAFILRMEGDKAKTWETSDDLQLFFDHFDARWVRALSDLLMDPFDDVRDHSAAVFQKIFSDERFKNFMLIAQGSQVDASGELVEIVRRADELARKTARADHSDGVARTCQLLYRFAGGEQQRLSLLSNSISELERKISVATKDLGLAVLEAPLHGDFSSLCYIWQVVSELEFSETELVAVQGLQDRLVTCCERAWAAVRDILCDDSPEGHLPQELEEVDGLDTKDVLSFSFRSTHEASNLMRVMIQSVRQKGREGRICPSTEVYERIGDLTFTQLATLRHRGAFTTVAATFATCCQLVKYLGSRDDGIQVNLLEIWYKGTLDAIFAQVSTTRRSAGIPAMMTGILSASATDPSFEQAMPKLMEIASIEARTSQTDGSNLPQVHAFNCMKDIFKSSYLTATGNNAEKYLPQCLELAANGLKSELWAIRNCALILLRSLLDCLFGSHESKATMEAGWDGKANRIAFHKYPTLPTVLLHLLKSGHQMMAPTVLGSAAAESVFPALDIIRRAGPPDTLRGELEEHIAKYLASPVWHVREIAARTLCSCLLHDKWLEAILQIARASVSAGSANVQNCVHGVLLTMKFTIERLNEVMLERLMGDLPQLEQFLREYWTQIHPLPSPEIAAAYMDVINMVRALPNSQITILPTFEIPDDKPESALLRAQSVIYKVYAASESSNPIDELRSLLFDDRFGVNSLIPALETIPRMWDVTKVTKTQLFAFCDLYVEVCLKIGPAEPRVLALLNLTEILDQLLKTEKLEDLSLPSFNNLWNSLPASLLNPALANAIIRISGCLLATQKSQGVMTGSLQNWGSMVADAGLDDKDFDTRFAAAESLCSFFTVVKSSCTTEEYLPALVALYDCLNDDDDEVRDIGSAAVKSVLGQALVPIEAASRLLHWLAQTFGNSSTFRNVVAARLTGDAQFKSLNIKQQLDKAMKFDDSLFAVEEQNLFIDEVRETQHWVSVFESLEWDASDEVLVSLTEWIQEGLRQMHPLVDIEDGPLGYASKPEVFAILSRIVQGSAALIRSHPDLEQRRRIDESSKVLRNARNHMSDLLLQPLQDTPSI